jgi:hypothetical protein
VNVSFGTPAGVERWRLATNQYYLALAITFALIATTAGRDTAGPRQSSKRFTATTALVPPNANALLMAARIGRSRA